MVSVVMCCHNSATRLPQTLAHLQRQTARQEQVPWEVIVVDNASTDDTAQVAQALWPPDAPAPLRVVHETQPGLSHARHRGFAAANYEAVSFIDDDNWVAPDWVELVAGIMASHPEVGACGGYSSPVTEPDIAWPTWFEQFKTGYAIGPQGEATGDISDSRGYLWGAGLTIRQTAWQQLAQGGFQSILTDRKGLSLSSGGDSELCYALRLTGHRLWYDERLQLQHYLPPFRLEWSYLRRLNRGFGASSVGHEPYHLALHNVDPASLIGPRSGRIWTWKLRETWRRFHAYRFQWPRFFGGNAEGNEQIITMERSWGRLLELLRQREQYDRNITTVHQAIWRDNGIEKQYRQDANKATSITS